MIAWTDVCMSSMNKFMRDKTERRSRFGSDPSLKTAGLVMGASQGWSRVQPAWVARYNGGLSRVTNQVVALQLDAVGNILVAGSSTSAAGDYDYLVLKYAPDGSRMWTARHASLNNGDD